MNKKGRRAIGCCALALIVLTGGATAASALILRGTSSTAVYTQEVARGGTGDEFENRTRLFERLRFDLLDLGDPRLTLHTYLTARNDLTNESIDDTRARLYLGYLEWRADRGVQRPFRYSARAGRQWVSAGVGSGTVDGIWLQADHRRWAGIALFAGTLGIEDRDDLRFDSPDDSRRLGGEVRLHPVWGDGTTEPEIAVSFADTRRDDIEDARRVGLRGSLFVRRQLRLWSETRHDFLLDRTFGSAAGIEFMKPARALRVWAEYNRRTPDIPASSVFAVFDTKPVAALRGGIGMGLGGPYRGSIDITRTDFKAPAYTVSIGDAQVVSRSKVDRATTYRFVLQRGAVQAGIRFESGFGGDRFGLVASADREFGEKWDARIDLGYESYDYGSLVTEDNTVSSGLLAVGYRPWRMTKVTAQIEGLNNRDLKRDVRLLARLDQRFSFGR
jgi:hypothetical protein